MTTEEMADPDGDVVPGSFGLNTAVRASDETFD
jgi:hypothetical protein